MKNLQTFEEFLNESMIDNKGWLIFSPIPSHDEEKEIHEMETKLSPKLAEFFKFLWNELGTNTNGIGLKINTITSDWGNDGKMIRKPYREVKIFETGKPIGLFDKKTIADLIKKGGFQDFITMKSQGKEGMQTYVLCQCDNNEKYWLK